jgi:hypothetical protein
MHKFMFLSFFFWVNVVPTYGSSSLEEQPSQAGGIRIYFKNMVPGVDLNALKEQGHLSKNVESGYFLVNSTLRYPVVTECEVVITVSTEGSDNSTTLIKPLPKEDGILFFDVPVNLTNLKQVSIQVQGISCEFVGKLRDGSPNKEGDWSTTVLAAACHKGEKEGWFIKDSQLYSYFKPMWGSGLGRCELFFGNPYLK